MPTPTRQPSAVRMAMRKLGWDIKEARKRRRYSMQSVAERAFTTRQTVQRIEQGDQGVSIGIYAAVLHALGLLEGLRTTADPAKDEVGLTLTAIGLPKRVRRRRREHG